MTQAHLNELVQQLGRGRELYWIPDDKIKAIADKWVSLKDNLRYNMLPPELSAEKPVVEYDGHLYVFGRTDATTFAVKYGKRREGMPDTEALLKDYGEEVNAVESIGGCLHHLCELSFGFTTTHHSYTGNEPDKLLALIEQVHGKSAAGTLQTAADAIGYSSITGMEEFCSQELVRNLLQIAQVQSDYHQGYRT